MRPSSSTRGTSARSRPSSTSCRRRTRHVVETSACASSSSGMGIRRADCGRSQSASSASRCSTRFWGGVRRTARRRGRAARQRAARPDRDVGPEQAHHVLRSGPAHRRGHRTDQHHRGGDRAVRCRHPGGSGPAQCDPRGGAPRSAGTRTSRLATGSAGREYRRSSLDQRSSLDAFAALIRKVCEEDR